MLFNSREILGINVKSFHNVYQSFSTDHNTLIITNNPDVTARNKR